MNTNKEKAIVMSKEEFEALPVEQQRILIAQDVIDRLNASKIKAKKGRYIDLDLDELESKGLSKNKSAKDNIDKIECSVCALGACLMSATKFKNKLTVGDLDIKASSERSRKSFSLLAGVFDPEQLLLIEDCFEGCTDGDRVGRDVFNAKRYKVDRGDDLVGNKAYWNEVGEYQEKITDFFDAHTEADDRLRAIMQNIIDNNGTFVI